MKKILIAILVVILTFSFVGCYSLNYRLYNKPSTATNKLTPIEVEESLYDALNDANKMREVTKEELDFEIMPEDDIDPLPTDDFFDDEDYYTVPETVEIEIGDIASALSTFLDEGQIKTVEDLSPGYEGTDLFFAFFEDTETQSYLNPGVSVGTDYYGYLSANFNDEDMLSKFQFSYFGNDVTDSYKEYMQVVKELEARYGKAVKIENLEEPLKSTVSYAYSDIVEIEPSVFKVGNNVLISFYTEEVDYFNCDFSVYFMDNLVPQNTIKNTASLPDYEFNSTLAKYRLPVFDLDDFKGDVDFAVTNKVGKYTVYTKPMKMFEYGGVMTLLLDEKTEEVGQVSYTTAAFIKSDHEDIPDLVRELEQIFKFITGEDGTPKTDLNTKNTFTDAEILTAINAGKNFYCSNSWVYEGANIEVILQWDADTKKSSLAVNFSEAK